MDNRTDIAVLAGGCAWIMQQLLRHPDGVLRTRTGFMGGKIENPTEENDGGHAEVVEVVFDPERLSFRGLLEVFFQAHRADLAENIVGSLYRSEIFCTSADQRRVAEEMIRDVDASGHWPGRTVTKISEATVFWPMPSEDQDYLLRFPHGCKSPFPHRAVATDDSASSGYPGRTLTSPAERAPHRGTDRQVAMVGAHRKRPPLWRRFGPWRTKMQAFEEAVEARDLDAVEAMLADDVVFRSPVAFAPYPGKAVTSAILRSVIEVFEDFRYVRRLHDGDQHAYVFTAKVDGLDVTGCDFLTYDEHGKINEFMVMVRPLKAAQALAARMAERYPAIKQAAAAWAEAQ